MAIGGASTAFSSPLYINPANPASYMAFDSTSFVFDAAFNLRSGTMTTIDQSQKTSYGSISNLYFGFPIAKWWRTSLGLMPYSNVGYEIRSNRTLTDFGNTATIYKGYGGLNKVYFGNAFSIAKGLSFGFNASYLFGTIVKQEALTCPDSAYFFNTMNKSSVRLNKLVYDAGLIYHRNLKDGKFYQIGLTFSPKQKIDGLAETTVYTYLYNYSSELESPKDTLSHTIGNNGIVSLPTSVGAGFMFGSTNRWFAIADITYQKWSEFTYLGSNPGLRDSYKFSLGGQFRPSAVDIGKYFDRVNYRAGLRFEQGYLELQNTRINDLGVSFGVGLPMKKSKSTLNLAVELGTLGTTNNGLIKENYVRFTIGTSLQERWFLKRRFN